MQLVALDLETECSALGCDGEGCDHALYPATSEITCIGLWAPDFQKVLRGPDMFVDLEKIINLHHFDTLTGHNIKFDLKHIHHHAPDFIYLGHLHDSSVMASAVLEKVPEKYLKQYEAARRKANKKLPKGYSHRKGGALSLKVLAPCFLGVEPFWEDPTNHDNDVYVLKDCEYSYKLTEMFSPMLERDGLSSFYSTKLMPWYQMLLAAEIKGITIDLPLLETKALEAETAAKNAKDLLDLGWADAHTAYRESLRSALISKYVAKSLKAVTKVQRPLTKEEQDRITQRYGKLLAKAQAKLPTRINYDSPAQLTWLLRDHLGLDITNFNDTESTGKEVLQKLATAGRDDIKLFLEYRRANKLATAFFPSYRALQVQGVLHTSFNITGTRTGRLSSSGPNLQQVPSALHCLFKARPGRRLITRDLSAIEPRIIAFYTEDPLLCELMLNYRDFHSQNAIIMFGLGCPEESIKNDYPAERFVAKTCGLALFYGAGPHRIRATALQRGYDWQLETCEEIYAEFKKAYATAFRFKEEIDLMAQSGEAIYSLFGRGHSYKAHNYKYIAMRAFNTLVQSTASDLLLRATHFALADFQGRGIDAYPLLWVHDEAVWEVPEADAELCQKIIEDHLTCCPLPTRYGDIPLTCEGKTDLFWSK